MLVCITLMDAPMSLSPATDHYGNKLISIVWWSSTVNINHPLSGELCCCRFAPQVSEYFSENMVKTWKRYTRMESACRRADNFPTLQKDPIHCIGKKGDVFLANYSSYFCLCPANLILGMQLLSNIKTWGLDENYPTANMILHQC